jgi:ABC-type amino acid transport substrate-binding protein
VLNVALPADRPGVSLRDANGIWSGLAVDLVRAIAEQLLGSPDRVFFSLPSSDAEERASLREGHIDMALLGSDPLTADLAGDGDRSWTVPGATPTGALTFLLPENQTIFVDTVNRILQTPLEAEILGFSSTNLPTANTADLTTAQRRFLDLATPTGTTSAGQGTPLATGFVSRVLRRLGNASELWNRFFPPAQRQPIVLQDQLQFPADGPALQATQPVAVPGGDDLAAIVARGELRVAIASQGKGPANLLPWQRDLLTAVAKSIGGVTTPLKLTLTPYQSPTEALDQLNRGRVDLLLPNDNDLTWLDGVIGVDAVEAREVSHLEGIRGRQERRGRARGLERRRVRRRR